MGSIAITSYDLFILLLLTACGAIGQGECADSGRSDTLVCVNIYQCKPVLDAMLNTRVWPPAIKKYFESLRCGSEGNVLKVWCEQQTVRTVRTVRTAETEIEHLPDVSSHVNLRLINSRLCGSVSKYKWIDLSYDSGNKTGIFDYPWMALLDYRSVGSTDLESLCGGTVINERYVLTAAHCLLNPLGAVVSSVRVGEHTISTERDCNIDENGEELACAEKYQDINVESIHLHPEYVIKNTANDIALVRLSRDIDFTPKNVKPICLPVGSAATPATKKVTVTGWGTTESGTQSDALLQINMPLVSNEDCANVYRNLVKISHKQLCAGGKRGVCVTGGYGGGPLQAQARYHNTVKFVQYGIVSFGLNNTCYKEGVPAVYTNVAYYMDWILNTIRP